MSVSLSPALVQKYNTQGPRYTSYPTALEFIPNDSPTALVEAFATCTTKDFSLYVHIPFCHALCYYCGCNKIVTRHQDKADRYLDFLAREMQATQTLMTSKSVEQCHLGGGTPTFLTITQMTRLVGLLRAHYNFSEQCEWSIEIDPRSVNEAYLSALYALGFSRISLGVQDVDSAVQTAINRTQSTEHVANLIRHAQNIGFSSVNIDLIYGLPKQTPETFTQTLEAVKAFAPERISLFSYAHLPTRFAAQRKIKDDWLPSPTQKAELMAMAHTFLQDLGYQMIGMDHFAQTEDTLAVALANKVLHRNFQGYTTHKHLDMLGLGVSSISFIGDRYVQNSKTLNTYYGALSAGRLAVEKTLHLEKDDHIRRAVIMGLMCNLQVDKQEIERSFDIHFASYFAEAERLLDPFMNDGLLTVDTRWIKVHPEARLLIRSIAMCFDAYMGLSKNHQRFSRVI
jgi:oxygen-independent coproporphyrinogen-3 oxidase